MPKRTFKYSPPVHVNFSTRCQAGGREDLVSIVGAVNAVRHIRSARRAHFQISTFMLPPPLNQLVGYQLTLAHQRSQRRITRHRSKCSPQDEVFQKCRSRLQALCQSGQMLDACLGRAKACDAFSSLEATTTVSRRVDPCDERRKTVRSCKCASSKFQSRQTS